MKKTPITLSIAALLTLTACGGSGDDQVGKSSTNGNQSQHNDTQAGHDLSYPSGKKFVGLTETGSNAKCSDVKSVAKCGSGNSIVAMGSDNLYTVQFNGAEYNILDTPMVFDSGAKDVAKTGIQGSAGLGGAFFSKGFLSYATFGVLADYDMTTHKLSNYRTFFQGEPTSVDSVPASGQATYQGVAFQQTDGDPELKGKMMAQVDFGNKSLDIELSDIAQPVSISGAHIKANRFNGQQDGVTWNGGFFGDAAAEIAGMANKGDEWRAAFGGKKQ